MGSVDTFVEREQLERFARRSLIPYIDVGMDVHDLKEHGFLVSGQIILSTPGNPCMRCCGFITDERLKREAERYGAAGSRPQVVWSNGVLASTAVGLLIQLITPWFPKPPDFAYMEYDGNQSTLVPSVYMRRAATMPTCPHHPTHELGDPLFETHTAMAGPLQGSTRALARHSQGQHHETVATIRHSTNRPASRDLEEGFGTQIVHRRLVAVDTACPASNW